MFGAVDSAFTQRSIAYDLIVGPKGSDLQLVLSAVYRMQPPIENLPYLYLEQLRTRSSCDFGRATGIWRCD